jgi:hypothetical protein
MVIAAVVLIRPGAIGHDNRRQVIRASGPDDVTVAAPPSRLQAI